MRSCSAAPRAFLSSLVRVCLRADAPLLTLTVSFLRGSGVLLADFFIRTRQLRVILRQRRFRLRFRFLRLLLQISKVILALLHEGDNRLIQQHVQPERQNHEIEHVQQNLLEIDIQRHIFT